MVRDLYNEIKKHGLDFGVRSYGNIKKELLTFLESGLEFAEIKNEDVLSYKDIRNCYNSYDGAARRYGFPVKVVRRKNKIYIIREGESE